MPWYVVLSGAVDLRVATAEIAKLPCLENVQVRLRSTTRHTPSYSPHVYYTHASIGRSSSFASSTLRSEMIVRAAPGILVPGPKTCLTPLSCRNS